MILSPNTALSREREKLVKELKEAAAESDGVLLATDPDREGGHLLAPGLYPGPG